MIKYILMDIEGTTTKISFVKDELFPYAYKKIDGFLRLNPDKVSAMGDDLTANIQTLKQWITEDKKEPLLKSLQGEIWKIGYESGDLKAHLYEDVLPQWKVWKEKNLKLGIYSSGSIAAQKLLFGHTSQGDINKYLSHYFDLGVGKKFDTSSYQKISEILDLDASSILFLSDIEDELDAAKEAGFQTTQLFRDEITKTKHIWVSSFDQIKLPSPKS